MARSEMHKPYGLVRTLGQGLKPVARTAMGVSFERDGRARVERLRAAARDRAAERRRPSRPKMRALSVAPGGRVAWKSVPTPRLPGPDGAVVHPIACGTCDLDRSLVLGRTPFMMPLHLGHEAVAEVTEVGPEVEHFAVGDRVVVPFQISCGKCPRCRAGLTGNCEAVPPLAMYGFGVAGGHWGGAIADYLAVPFADDMLVPLPEGVAPEAAASVSDNLCDAHRHVAPHLPRIMEREPSPTVLVIAAQAVDSLFSPSVPLYAAQIAKALGAGRVVFADARAPIRDRAAELGFEPLDPADLSDLEPAPLVVEVSATAKGLRRALEATAPDGTCSSSGSFHAGIRIPAALMFARNASLHIGRSNARADMPAVLELIASGQISPERVTTHTAPLDTAPTAILEHACGNSIKTILTE